MRMKPFFPFYGSKYRLARHYPAPTETVVEPFAGSACYSTYHGVKEAILIDADPNISETWRYLLNATADDIAMLPDLRGEGDCVDDYDIPPGAKKLIGFWLTKGSTPSRRRGAYAASDKWRHLFWRPEVKERIASQISHLSGWSIVAGDFEKAPLLAGATYFIDPPYQQAGKHYRVKFDDFDRLGQWAKSLPGSAIVCEGEGADWLPFRAMGEFKTFATGSSPEMVWTKDAGNH